MDFSNEKIIGRVIEIPNDDILPNRFQPRKYFDEADTLELAESIKEHGILQPIVVRSVGDKYEIIAGERRFKANILAGNDSIPAIVSNLNDKESSEIAVIENIQRQNLTPIEEAISYKRIIDMGYVTQEDLAKKVGKSQSAIANKIRLLKLSDNVQEALMEKRISERHARSLLKLESLKKQDELLERIINERLTVRKTDEEIKKMNNNINNQTIPNYNQPQTNEFNPFDQPVQQPAPTLNIDTPQVNGEVQPQVSPIMGTPVSNFEKQPVNNEQIQNNIPSNSSFQATTPVSMPNNNNPSEEGLSNQQLNLNQTQMMDQPIINDPEQSVVETQSVNELQNEFNPFDQAVVQQQPVQQVQDSIFNMNIPQPVPEVQPQSDPNSVEQEQNDIPLSSQPVSDFNIQPNTSFLDTTPLNINENNTDSSNQQLTYPKSNFETAVNTQSNFNIPSQVETPTFTVEQPVETNVGLATPVVDLNQSIEPTQNNDIPLTSTIAEPQTQDPIIVTNDDSQFDPIMPEQPSNEPTLDFKTIINLIRQCSETIEKCGYKIDTEEYDLEGKYQVTFTIEK